MDANFRRGVKMCAGCGEEKALSEFTKDYTKLDGLYPKCKKCIPPKAVRNHSRTLSTRETSKRTEKTVAKRGELITRHVHQIVATQGDHVKHLAEVMENLMDVMGGARALAMEWMHAVRELPLGKYSTVRAYEGIAKFLLEMDKLEPDRDEASISDEALENEIRSLLTQLRDEMEAKQALEDGIA